MFWGTILSIVSWKVAILPVICFCELYKSDLSVPPGSDVDFHISYKLDTGVKPVGFFLHRDRSHLKHRQKHQKCHSNNPAVSALHLVCGNFQRAQVVPIKTKMGSVALRVSAALHAGGFQPCIREFGLWIRFYLIQRGAAQQAEGTKSDNPGQVHAVSGTDFNNTF